ncbi:hypothetical protein CALCODRAFT_483624 [Calocera cornea HHB12733]|uniref:NmrA-like domain-containing protein n=1 Tax=Calocera cornea HHB12733 TaxID=1353952 RepID=A0A165FJV3_9BASI|nr:hypothetical protein CALCODRAFT_483624 [Calocera cornea HHB12733]
MVYGPPMQAFHSLDQLNESVDELWKFFDGKAKEVPFTTFLAFIDVRDLLSAYLRVASPTNEKANNQHYLAVGGRYSFDEADVIVQEAFPEQAARMTPSDGKPAPEYYKTDASKTEADFGIKWTPFKKTVVDSADAIFKAEAQFASA